jgi:hypothetical protein
VGYTQHTLQQASPLPQHPSVGGRDLAKEFFPYAI